MIVMNLNAITLCPSRQDLIDQEHFFVVNMWERDFIINCLFKNYKINNQLTFIDDAIHLNESIDILWLNCRIVSIENVISIAAKFRPKIIILSADEYSHENLSVYNSLAQYCDLFLRQYHHNHYTYSNNTIHIPLGYNNGFYSEEYYTPKVKGRYYNWTHFGYLKSDRQEMLMEFSSIENHYAAYGIPADEVRIHYLKSIFVPCGRGNSTLDCYRLYEASMCGAIPVIAADKNEIDITFKYENSPPWIFAPTWKDAVNKCRDLLEDRKQLQQLQDTNIQWWNTRIHNIVKQINDCLGMVD